MVNINLTTADAASNKKVDLTKDIPLLIVVLILAVIVYAGLMIYGRTLSDKIQGMNVELSSRTNQLENSSKDVMNFQNRLVSANGLLAQKDEAKATLGELEKDIIPGVYVESYQYSSQSGLDLTCVADNFDDMAKQILSFKNSANYAATVGKSDMNNGKIEFDINLKDK